MYFWRINDLKQSLAQRPLSALESVKYVIAPFVVVTVVQTIHDYFFPASREWVYRLLGPTLAWICLPVFCFLKNGGAEGADFLGRYVSIHWVIAIRYALLFLLPLVLILGALIWITPDALLARLAPIVHSSVAKTAAKAFFMAIAILPFFWRMGVHFETVRKMERRPNQASDATSEPAPGAASSSHGG